VTTVFILTSGRPTNKAWDKFPPLSLELHTNKSLLEIKKYYTFLDFQMDMLSKNGLTDVYIIVGFQKDEIQRYCERRGYKVKFIDDPDWEYGAYSSARTLWEIRDVLSSVSTPIITLYNDVLFNQKTIDELLKCQSDVCSIQNSQNIIKWSKRGIEELIKILDEDEECRYNWDGLSYPVWGKLRWNDNITFKTIWYVYMLNVSTDDDYIEMRKRYK